jgi:Ca2+-binding RTX toxin-like protein
MMACALVLGVTSALQAQDVSCPIFNRMTMQPSDGSAPPNLLDGASYAIWIGRSNNALGISVLTAIVQRNGVCMPKMWVRDGAGFTTRLTTDTNLCLGSGNDIVSVLQSSSTVSGCGAPLSMTAFAYNGRRLATYAGAGSDIVTGGSGKDHVFGGAGGDVIRGGSGSEDELYGESGADTLVGSTGSATWSSGGTQDDAVVDTQGANDSLSGDSGNDALSSSCNSSFLFCGTGTDTARSPDPRPPLTDCESWEDLSC